MVKGKAVQFFQENHENPEIETLDKKLVTVATDMTSGREVWITKVVCWMLGLPVLCPDYFRR